MSLSNKELLDKEWISVKDQLPDVEKLGDGNACLVEVKDTDGEFRAIYGTSGAPGEPISFFSQRPITHWRPIVKERLFTRSEVESCIKDSLQAAAENAKWGRQLGTNKRSIIKSSITDPKNIKIK